MGGSGTYSADFYSKLGSLSGEIYFHEPQRWDHYTIGFNPSERQYWSGTDGSFSTVWKPEITIGTGTFNVCCQAYNDEIATCVHPDLLTGSTLPMYSCQGPNTCMTVVVTEQLLMGDINDDTIVDIQDYTLLSNDYGPNDPYSPVDKIADLNNDTTVDIQDFIILSKNFGKTLE